ncbi:hypothetical protein JCM33374_g3220 [Metschnikowia sp. JCM 33374]|nr:hypothetical protein JCM33374_g3220 [Metschnikowia sp. JCM 33374]
MRHSSLRPLIAVATQPEMQFILWMFWQHLFTEHRVKKIPYRQGSKKAIPCISDGGRASDSLLIALYVDDSLSMDHSLIMLDSQQGFGLSLQDQRPWTSDKVVGTNMDIKSGCKNSTYQTTSSRFSRTIKRRNVRPEIYQQFKRCMVSETGSVETTSCVTRQTIVHFLAGFCMSPTQ